MAKKIWECTKPNLGGRPRFFRSANDMYEKFIDYCKYVDDNPWVKSAVNKSQGNRNNQTSTQTNQSAVPLQRAYTLYGFLAFCGMGSKWADIKRTYNDDKFSEVISWIEHVVTSTQVEGALLHQFDSNLVARLNCIADHNKNEITGKNGSPLNTKIEVEIIDKTEDVVKNNQDEDSDD